MLTHPTDVHLDLGAWEPDAPAPPERAIIVAPHPDDEVLGLATVMRWLRDEGTELVLVACTDGEASHSRSDRITLADLRDRRAEERAQALLHLGLGPSIQRLGLPDRSLDQHVDDVVRCLLPLGGPEAAFIVPWEHDDHPDHRAAHAAGAIASTTSGAAIWQVPIWGKVRPGADYDGMVSHLRLSSAAADLKARAVDEFVSQIEPIGPGPFDGPVVQPAELAEILDGYETVIW